MANTFCFCNSRAALAVYDAGAAERAAAWDEIETNEDVATAEALDASAKRRVQEAFYEDTKHINSLENCLRIDVESIRRIAGPAQLCPA